MEGPLQGFLAATPLFVLSLPLPFFEAEEELLASLLSRDCNLRDNFSISDSLSSLAWFTSLV